MTMADVSDPVSYFLVAGRGFVTRDFNKVDGSNSFSCQAMIVLVLEIKLPFETTPFAGKVIR